MIKVAIVEDEIRERNLLRSFFDRFAKEYQVEFSISEFTNGIDFLEQYRPCYDLVLMDIQMPLMNGMEAAEKLRKLDESVVLIFVTNMTQYAVKGYEVKALSFLVKPINYPSFSLSVQRAQREFRKRRDEVLTVNTSVGLMRIPIDTIRYFEVSGHTLLAHLLTESVKITQHSMATLEDALKPLGFFRCHVGYLVNVNHITRVTGNSVFVGDTELLISRAKKKIFLKEIAEYAEGR